MNSNQSEPNQTTAKLFGDIFIHDHARNKSICILDKQGKKCGTEIASKRPYNLKRHVSKVHPNFSVNIVDNDISDVHESDILNILTEIFTINGRPFSMFKDSGFSKFYQLLVHQIERNSKQKIHIDMIKIKSHIVETVKEMKKILGNELKHKPIAIMMDIATKNKRAILGINVQYILNNRIVIRTLRMIRLNESHTGAHLAQLVKEILSEYGILLDQLFSVTTDNAGYMLLSSEILDSIVEEEAIESDDFIELSDDQIDEVFYRRLLKETEEEFLNLTVPEHVKSIRCGAHKFQLAIGDAFSLSKEADNLVVKVRAIMKKLRNVNFINALRNEKFKMPCIDNQTRWNGKYFMMKRFSELKQFINMCGLTDKSFNVTELEWEKIKELQDILYQCLLFTQRIQAVQTTLSDFYADWVELKLKLAAKSHITFAVNLVDCMDKRGQDMLSDPLILSALFLDLRYRILLNATPIQKQTAMNHLTLLWKRVCDLKPKPDQIQNETNHVVNNAQETDNTVDNVNLMDAYLNSLENASQRPSNESVRSEHIMMKLQQFNVDMEQMKREPNSRHPMDFWFENKHSRPELNELAKLIFAVSPTETSVERNFSALSYILNKYRCNLSDEMLENILFVRLNKDLFEDFINHKK